MGVFSPWKFQVNSPEDIERIVQTIIESTAKIIVVFSSDVDLSPLVLELIRQNVTNRTWIASEAWVTSALINRPGVGPRIFSSPFYHPILTCAQLFVSR